MSELNFFLKNKLEVSKQERNMVSTKKKKIVQERRGEKDLYDSESGKRFGSWLDPSPLGVCQGEIKLEKIDDENFESFGYHSKEFRHYSMA